MFFPIFKVYDILLAYWGIVDILKGDLTQKYPIARPLNSLPHPWQYQYRQNFEAHKLRVVAFFIVARGGLKVCPIHGVITAKILSQIKLGWYHFLL